MMNQMGMLNDPNMMALMQQLMARDQQNNQMQQQGQGGMGMLSQILPLLMAGKTSAPTSVKGSGGPLTVPAGSQINQMAPDIRRQLAGGGMGLLKGLF